MAPSGELQCLAEFLPSLSFEHMWILACSKGLYTICSKFLGHCHLFAVIDHEIKVLHSKPCQQEFTIRGSMTAELHPIPPSIFQKPAVSQKQWSKIIKSDDDEDCDSQGVGWRTREETRTLKFLPLEWSLGSGSAGGWRDSEAIVTFSLLTAVHLWFAQLGCPSPSYQAAAGPCSQSGTCMITNSCQSKMRKNVEEDIVWFSLGVELVTAVEDKEEWTKRTKWGENNQHRNIMLVLCRKVIPYYPCRCLLLPYCGMWAHTFEGWGPLNTKHMHWPFGCYEISLELMKRWRQLEVSLWTCRTFRFTLMLPKFWFFMSHESLSQVFMALGLR